MININYNILNRSQRNWSKNKVSEEQKVLSNNDNWPVTFLGIGLPNTEFKSNTCINKNQTYNRSRQPLNRPEIIKV